MPKPIVTAVNAIGAINRALGRETLKGHESLISVSVGPSFDSSEPVKFDVLVNDKGQALLVLFTKSGSFSAEIVDEAIAEFFDELF